MATAVPYPFELVPRVSRADAALQSVVARWLAARGGGGTARLHALVGGAVRARVVPAATGTMDPEAAACEVRVAGASIIARGSSRAVRRLAQKILGGPDELAAPRPLGKAEQAVWALVVATALEDLGVAGEVWPVEAEPVATAVGHKRAGAATAVRAIELAVDLAGIALVVQLAIPAALAVRVPPAVPPPAWTERASYELPIVVARCAIERTALAALCVRDVITVEGGTPELVVLGGAVGLVARPGAVVAEVATGYVRRDMSLPDEAYVELTVALGTARMSLRQLIELSIGQIVPLGRPLAGPFELRADGRRVGQGELVDVDGELAVRIVSLESE